MATNAYDRENYGAPFADIYNDPVASLPRPGTVGLPGGACNYVDLSPGANGAKCGCRRFWVRSAEISPDIGGAGWCMCNHHACFHDDGPRDIPPPVEAYGPGQENERPRTGREPLSPMVDLGLQMPPPPVANPRMDFPIFDDGLGLFRNISDQAPLAEIHGPQDATNPPGSLPDTLAWGDVGPSLAPSMPKSVVPPHTICPSQATSTTSSVRARYLRPFAGKGLATLDIPKELPYCSPSRFLPGFSQSSQVPTKGLSNPTVVRGDTQAEIRGQSSQGVDRETFQNLSDTVGAHEQRLDRLETVSFSAPAHDDCQEKHDHTDLRITDLESRMEEAEKLNAARLAEKNDDATASVASFSTAGPIHSQDFQSQLQALQAQVTSLQSSLPTFIHPWEVEVVFLPFPLKRLWLEPHQFKSEGIGLDDWTQMPMTCSANSRRSMSPFPGDWAPKDHDIEWLLPKACGDKSIIDRRLRSRGLIRTVSVKGGDARSVQIAMRSVFGDTWKEMGLPSAPEAPGPPHTQFLGLQSSWIPLRKVHKDSRLRFLTPAEMLNPTVWDVQFLNSVMMRASEPRLFITHPDAYLQDFQSYETGWTWQRVRELTRVYTENESSQEVPEADALEDCWAWTDTLDELPGTQTSMSMRNERSRLRACTGSPAVQNMTSWRSSSPIVGATSAGQSLIRRSRRPSYIRTTSVPPEGVGGHPSPMTTARRRVMSGGQSRRASPGVRGAPQFAVSKRRRARSPSYARFTPRFTTSPSPMPMSHERQYVRGTTPFAYATPHSNAPLQEARTIRAGSAAPIPAEYMADMAYDELYEIKIYESDSEMSFGEDEDDDEEDEEDNIASANLSALVPHAQPQRRTHLPEDEPWPGIEDQEQQISDGENVDPAEDRRSVASSQPSEYPSTNRAWPEDTAAGFRIHEDA